MSFLGSAAAADHFFREPFKVSHTEIAANVASRHCQNRNSGEPGLNCPSAKVLSNCSPASVDLRSGRADCLRIATELVARGSLGMKFMGIHSFSGRRPSEVR